jgi:hypothetical protein
MILKEFLQSATRTFSAPQPHRLIGRSIPALAHGGQDLGADFSRLACRKGGQFPGALMERNVPTIPSPRIPP